MKKVLRGSFPRRCGGDKQTQPVADATGVFREFISAEVIAAAEARYGKAAQHLFIDSVWALLPAPLDDGTPR